MDVIKFSCRHCGQHLEAEVDMAGQLIDCPTCKQAIELPWPQTSLNPLTERPLHTPTITPTPKLTRPSPSSKPVLNRMHGGLLFLLVAVVLFRLCCGIYVIQPIGAMPDGATVLYWRVGLNLPFVSSADGFLEKSDAGVSLLGRGIFLVKIADALENRKITTLSYSRSLYLLSTGGREYER